MSNTVAVPVIAVTIDRTHRFLFKGDTLPVGVSDKDVARLLAAGRVRPAEVPVVAAVDAPVQGDGGQATVRRTRTRAKAQG